MQKREEWRTVNIAGYEGYEVSNTGFVRCYNPRNRNAIKPEQPRVLTPNCSATGGYEWVTLYGNGVPLKKRVHQLVADAFLGEKPDGKIISHLDDDPRNNNVSNLSYQTQRSNALDKSFNSKKHTVLKYLDEYGQYINRIAESKGFWDESPSPNVYLAKMALIHSEISEMLEAYRKEKGSEALTEEFADALIRLLDLWAAMEEDGLVGSLREAVIQKVSKNMQRPRKHGNLI